MSGYIIWRHFHKDKSLEGDESCLSVVAKVIVFSVIIILLGLVALYYIIVVSIWIALR